MRRTLTRRVAVPGTRRSSITLYSVKPTSSSAYCPSRSFFRLSPSPAISSLAAMSRPRTNVDELERRHRDAAMPRVASPSKPATPLTNSGKVAQCVATTHTMSLTQKYAGKV